MRAFVVLSLIAVASAGRLGYDYQQGVSGSSELSSSGSGINNIVALGGQGAGLSLGSVGGSLGGGSLGGGSLGGGSLGGGSFGGGSLGGGSLGGLSLGGGSLGGGSLGGGSLGGGSLGGGSLGGGSLGGGHGGASNQVIDGGLTKEFFIFSAPEEQVQEGQSHENIVTQIKKNLRVIFIRAPENNAVHNSALNLVRQATEDKTAIYVLVKEADASEIAHQVEQISENIRAKPEVRFVKYRTQQDALNAQQTIQQQYEQLGGSSQSSDEGVAPVLNYASPAEHHHSGHSHGAGLVGAGSSVGSGSVASAPVALNFGSASEQSSQSVNLGSLGSGSSLSGQVVKSQSSYLPPSVKK